MASSIWTKLSVVSPILFLGVASPGYGQVTSALRFATSGPPSVVIDFELPPISFDSGLVGMNSFQVQGLVTTSESGMPLVKGTGVAMVAPKGYQPVLKIVSIEERLQENTVLEPHRRKYRCSGAVDLTPMSRAFYNSKDAYPKEAIRLEKLGNIQEAEIFRVSINPIQMDMAKRAVRLISQARIQVDFLPIAGVEPKRLDLTPAMFRIINNMTVNAAVLPRNVSNNEPERMLIIVPDEYKDALAEFVTWKGLRGISVNLVKRSEAGNTADAVKTFVQKMYDNTQLRPTYLLMVGNGANMPPHFRPTSSGNAASDYPFSLLSGVDILPDVIYGRLVADNIGDLQIQVRRWIDYERDAKPISTWYPFATNIASQEQGAGPSDEDYANQIQSELKGHTYLTVDSLFQKSQAATAANIKSSLAAGRSWLTYIGHGSGTSWGSTNDTFDVAAIGSLTNTGKLPVIFDVACMNGGYTTFNPCFGKKWVTHQVAGQSAGAVGYYGASVSTSWDPPAVMAVGIAKRHFERSLNTFGGSALGGQMYLVEQMGVGEDIIDNLEWYNLFGDPSLQMRTSVPQLPQVQIDPGSIASAGLSLSVRGPDGKPIAGATATLRPELNDVVYAVGRSDDQGHILLSTSSRGKSVVASRLLVTGYNLQPVEIRVE